MRQLNRIWRYMRQYRLSVLLYVVFILLSQVFALISLGMLIPVLRLLFLDGGTDTVRKTDPGIIDSFSYLLEDFAHSGDKSTTLLIVCCVLVAAIVLKNVFLYLAFSTMFPVRHGVIRQLRNDMFTKILSLPVGYFTEERKGDLVSRMTHDVTEVQESVMSVMDAFVKEPIAIILYLATMIRISPTLMLGILILLPVAALLIGKVGSSLRRAARRMAQQWSEITTVLDETISGIRVVKAFNAERHQYLRFLKLNNQNYRERNKVAIRQEAASPLSETLGVIMVAGVLWFGGRLVLSGAPGALKGEEFIFFIVLLSQIINPFKSLSNAYNVMQRGIAALLRMEEVLQVKNTITDAPHAQTVEGFQSSIELRNVSFAYNDKVILKDINLVIEKGKTVALVGSSGAGKSTLADLIPRFHEVSEGEILLDGVNIKEYKLSELRRLFGIVSQEPILFNDTIRANISLGTGGASLEDVQQAARVAHAQGFIEAKPEGYETVVGDRGARLSGGERQRVTIARAVLKNPPIMILDEATSSLDTESERSVQEALVNLMKNRTSIVIAHRLSTVKGADEIVVLDKGHIAERGSHAELIAQDGIYRRLVEMQEVK